MKIRSHASVAVLILLLIGSAAQAASRPPIQGTGGAVASDEHDATAVGLEILGKGGNAVDAAVATALALAVVAPEAGNLGGGGFAVVKIGEEVAFLDFREVAPAAARRDTFLDAQGQPIPKASLIGPLAAGVPGSPHGLFALHERFGKLPWNDVVAPAQSLARDGFVLSARGAESLVEELELLKRFPETASIWTKDGEPLPAGTRVTLPALAETLANYALRGPEAIMKGAAAEAIVAASKRHGGILTVEDLATYQPTWRAPLRFQALGRSFATADLPSAGGIVLAATLHQLEQMGFGAEPRFGAGRAHRIAEALRRANADRLLLGDPATSQATSPQLLAIEATRQRLSSFQTDKATASARLRPRAGSAAEASDTTHLSVIDTSGNAVALTTTVNGLYGCGLVVPELGFFLNNEMDDFATAPGKPNDYGLIQGEANAVGPGKKMLSSMTPTIAWSEKGDDLMVLGGRGGSRIPTAVLQVLLNVLVDGDDLQQAQDRPRLHHQWLPDELKYEPDALAPETIARLIAFGHMVKSMDSIAQVQAVRRLVKGGEPTFQAAADPRAGGGHGGVLAPRR